MPTEVSARCDGATATITLRSRDGLHVLSREALQALREQIDALSTRPGLKLLVLTGDGARAFSAGAHLRELSELDVSAARAYSALGQDLAMAIARFPAITLAALNGPAFGGGIELALACDFRVARPESRLHYQASLLGLLPGWGGTQRLPLWVGRARANAMMLLSEPVAASKAQEWGLVDEVADDLDACLARWQKRVDNLDGFALLQIKRALDQTAAMDFAGEREAFAACFADGRARVRIQEWFQKAGGDKRLER